MWVTSMPEKGAGFSVPSATSFYSGFSFTLNKFISVLHHPVMLLCFL